MEIKEGMKVTIKSSNDLLQAYEDAKIPFIVKSVFSDGVEDYVTLTFEDGEPFNAVIFGYELEPYLVVK